MIFEYISKFLTVLSRVDPADGGDRPAHGSLRSGGKILLRFHAMQKSLDFLHRGGKRVSAETPVLLPGGGGAR